MIYYTLGVVLAFSLGFIIPSNQNEQALIDDTRWRIVYVYVPVAIFLTQYLGLILIAKYDGIKYLLTKNNLAEARLAIKQFYQTAANSDEATEQIISDL